MRVRTLAAVVVGAVVVVAILGVIARPADPAPSPSSMPTPSRPPSPTSPGATIPGLTPAPSLAAKSPAAPLSVTDLLATLKVAPEHRSGYDRDLFPHWIDADGDGCNTRYEVLIAEAVVAPTITGTCHLTGGSWLSPYDGVTLDDAAKVQIDHMVPLAEAWYSGAFAWTTERRQALANDLDVPWTLVGVSGKTNEAKGSSDPASWLPPRRAAVCPYLDSWVAVKVRWGLTIDIDEREALTDRLADCPDTSLTVPIAAP
jgi:hypothetical protein